MTLINWKNQLTHDGLNPLLRMQLREFLTPVIELRKPFAWHDEGAASESSENLNQIVDWKLVLTANNVHSTIDGWDDEQWKDILPELFDDIQQLLYDALDLLRELGEANDLNDRSHLDLPSISPHWQNRGFSDWITLIELLRDAWLAIWSDDPEKAIKIAENWFEFPYLTFKRLAFFAASHDGCIDSAQWVKWLLSDNAWWLWSAVTKREVARLLTLQGHRLSSSQSQLETTILAGPPRDMYKEDLEVNRWREIADESMWFLLAKLDASGLDLGSTARNRLNELSTLYPRLKLLPHEREEFAIWMSGTGAPDYEENKVIDIAPRKRHELASWLRSTLHQSDPFKQDTWRDTCRTRFFHCLFALYYLTKENVWPVTRWQAALREWSKEDQVQRSWHYAAPLIQTMPDDILLKVAHEVAWWLHNAPNSDERHHDIQLNLCRRLLDLSLEPDSGEIQKDKPFRNAVSIAFNHPVGLVTTVLLSQLFKQVPHDNTRLPDSFEDIFTKLCDTKVGQYRHGRIVLASRVIPLFRLDRIWTENHLLPLFHWSINSMETQNVWRGFLLSPRIYRPLLISFMPQFLETASHYNELGDYGEQYAGILVYAALEFMNDGESPDFRQAIEELPQQGLREAARTLSHALESSGDQSENYWTNRIRPFWEKNWPKSKDLVSDNIAESLVLTSIAAGEKFPEALDLFIHWIQPIEYPHYVLSQLDESNLCKIFPEYALKLLDVIIQDQIWLPREFGQCLTAISQAKPEIEPNTRYRRLTEQMSDINPI